MENIFEGEGIGELRSTGCCEDYFMDIEMTKDFNRSSIGKSDSEPCVQGMTETWYLPRIGRQLK